jgi:HK97 family phage prohead protease
MKSREKITKTFDGFVTKLDGERGIVTAIVSVLGNIDQGNDIIHPGAFTQTIIERGGKIKVLDNHNMFSGMDAIAKMISIKEIDRQHLPDEIKDITPDAAGGLEAKFKFMLDDDKSAGIFKRIEAGVISQYSIGFEIIQSDISNVVSESGEETSIRNIREIRLWEISPVIFAMNDKTATVDVKNLPFDLYEQPQPELRLRSSEKFQCSSCYFFAKVHNNIGFCKQYESPTAKELTCDEWQVKVEPIPEHTFADELKPEVSDFLETFIDYYSDGAFIPQKDIQRLLDLKDTLVSAIVNLFPSDILSTEIVLNESKEQESEDLDTSEEAETHKRLLHREQLLQQARQKQRILIAQRGQKRYG